MSLKHSAVLLKASGLSLILVPLIMKGLGFIRILPQAGIYSVVGVGAAMLILGMVFGAKTMKPGMGSNREKAGPEK